MGKFSGKFHPQRFAKMQLGPGLWWTTASTLNGCTQPQVKSELSRMLCFCPPIHCFILGVGGRGRSSFVTLQLRPFSTLGISYLKVPWKPLISLPAQNLHLRYLALRWVPRRLNIRSRCLRSLLFVVFEITEHDLCHGKTSHNIRLSLLGVKNIPFFFHFLQRTLRIPCTMPQRQRATCHESVGVESNRAGIYKHFLG